MQSVALASESPNPPEMPMPSKNPSDYRARYYEPMACHGVKPGLHALLDGEALVDPVGGKVSGEDEDAQFLETHTAECCVRRANVGAMVKGAAAAVNH